MEKFFGSNRKGDALVPRKPLPSIVVIALVVRSFAVVQNAMAQATATQNVSLTVNAVYKIATSGNPGAMTITAGTAGSDALTTVSDPSTSYSITQNSASTVKVTANLDAAMAAGYTLQLNLASTKSTSAGTVDISATTPASAANVVTNIALGADANQAITSTFGALASAGVLASTAKVVTLTLTNQDCRSTSLPPSCTERVVKLHLAPSLCFYRPFLPEIAYHQEQSSQRRSKSSEQTFRSL